MRQNGTIRAVMLGMALTVSGCRHREDHGGYEAVLRSNLRTMRDVIGQYHGDKGDYPASLEALVDAGYLRKIPFDPFTKSSATWTLSREASPGADGVRGIVDVHSGADGTRRDGVPLARL